MRISEARGGTSVVRRPRPAAGRAATSASADALLAVIARAATPAERALLLGVAIDAVEDRSTLPPWATDLLWLFGEARPSIAESAVPASLLAPFTHGELTPSAASGAIAATPETPWAFHAMYEPFVRRGAADLRALGAERVAALGTQVQRAMLARLAQRLSGVCTRTLLHEVSPADILTDHPGLIGHTVHAVFFGDERPRLRQWGRLFGSYPVLARLMAVAYRNWCDSTLELARRLRDDRSVLEASFGDSALGTLTGCVSGIGDSHDHGRTVSLLTFSCGTRVVYKPKDLRISGAYAALVAVINASGLEPALPDRVVVSREGYTWEEFVPCLPCRSTDDLHRFYLRMGMHARLVQLLDGTDFTGDNVIASGERPVLIDLEGLLSPRMPVSTRTAPSVAAAAMAVTNSPARGCIVTAKIFGERGRLAADLGALAPAGPCLAPFKQRMWKDAGDGKALVEVYPEFGFTGATPVHDGHPADSQRYFDDVATGYVRMGAQLRRLGPELAAAGGVLAAFRDVQVRCLCRDTHIYARMLESSLEPSRLRDGPAREACLERLRLARFTTPAVATAEIDALRDLDIPMFASRPGDAALRVRDTVLVDSFFERPAYAGLLERVAALASATEAGDQALIESLLYTLSPTAARTPDRGTAHRSAPSRNESADWLTAADGLGHELMAAAVGTLDEPQWVGGAYHPFSGAWTFSALTEELYSGSAGIGIVLAELAAATGSPRAGRAARGALRAVAAHLGDRRSQLLADPVSLPLGAAFGWSGWVHACDRGAALLHDESLASEPASLFRALAQLDERQLDALLTRGDAWDIGSGVAGLLLVAIAPGAGTPDRTIVATAAARSLHSHVTAGATTRSLYPVSMPPRGIPDEAVGVALAMAVSCALGFASRDQRHSCDVPPASRATTTGALLGRMALARADGRCRVATLAAVEAYLAVAVRDTDGQRWLDRGEVALAAYRTTGAERFLQIALDAGARLRHLKQSHGRWMPECRLADRYHPSAITGLGAIAHFFLQLASPSPFPSYRTLR
jgi:type 2 lantibiotic biosynthesis protein LanM